MRGRHMFVSSMSSPYLLSLSWLLVADLCNSQIKRWNEVDSRLLLDLEICFVAFFVKMPQRGLVVRAFQDFDEEVERFLIIHFQCGDEKKDMLF